MTYEETMALLYLARRLYPRDKSLGKSTQEMAEIGEAWADMLKDIPFELGKAALAAHTANVSFAPAISEIRAYARRIMEPEPLSPEEAWAKAYWTMRHIGCSPYKNYTTGKYDIERAQEQTPPEVWRIMELLGYASMCRSEHVETVRAQFIKAWEREQKRKEERAALLPFLPEALKARFLAVGEGTQGAERALPEGAAPPDGCSAI